MSHEILRGDADNHRGVALAAGLIASGVALGVAGAWAKRRIEYENTARRFTSELDYLEGEAGAQHDAVARRVAAISLVYPEGASKNDFTQLLVGTNARWSFARAVHVLRYDEKKKVDGQHMYALQVAESGSREPRLKPHPKFVDAFIAAQQAEWLQIPQLTLLFQTYYQKVHGPGAYDHEAAVRSLYPYATDPGALERPTESDDL